MREVGVYSFSSQLNSEDEAKQLHATVSQVVLDWIVNTKGAIKKSPLKEIQTVTYKDGRAAQLRCTELSVANGRVSGWQIDEPPKFKMASDFRTTISVARHKTEVAVYCAMEAGNPENIFTPKQVDVHCPAVIRSILQLPVKWLHSGKQIEPEVLTFTGTSGAEKLKLLLQDNERRQPVVLISCYGNQVAFPDIDRKILKEIIGLAIVAKLDEEASRHLSALQGKEYSCYYGAIRIYWPGFNVGQSQFYHPLWTMAKLRELGESHFLGLMRKRLFPLSAYATEKDIAFGNIESLAKEEEFRQKTKSATDAKDFQKLADDYALENTRLGRDIDLLKGEIQSLKAELYREKNLREYYQSFNENPQIATVPSPEPSTVKEAVDQAKEKFSDVLCFGDDIPAGVTSLDPNAGPPKKIFTWLEKLADASRHYSANTLGKDIVQWLTENGCSSSKESETTASSRKETRKRTWHDGNGRSAFELHMKVKEGTSPGDCVRIYFKLDEGARKVIVGWIGRHL